MTFEKANERNIGLAIYSLSPLIHPSIDLSIIRFSLSLLLSFFLLFFLCVLYKIRSGWYGCLNDISYHFCNDQVREKVISISALYPNTLFRPARLSPSAAFVCVCVCVCCLAVQTLPTYLYSGPIIVKYEIFLPEFKSPCQPHHDQKKKKNGIYFPFSFKRQIV